MNDAKTKGAWLVHLGDKLENVTGATRYGNIAAAGKATRLLSALSASDERVVETGKVQALAEAASINSLELPSLLGILEDRLVIDRSSNGAVAVLGVSTDAALAHGAAIFDELHPRASEIAALELSEIVSAEPLAEAAAKKFVGDHCKLSSSELVELFDDSERAGFIDFEPLKGTNEKIYFNGNVFRRDAVEKTARVLHSLSVQERAAVAQLEEVLTRSGCVPVESARTQLGQLLFDKLVSVGLYDVSTVTNDAETVGYLTRPAAFNKFGNPFADDALDLAKALVASLTYGMSRSSYARGQISAVHLLMRKLINGGEVGPVRAIGQDYRALELRGVVEIIDRGYDRYGMKLLKREVGELALDVLRSGDASASTVSRFPGAQVTSFAGPEPNRVKTRGKALTQSKDAVGRLLAELRTGKF